MTPEQDRAPEECFLDEMVDGYRDGRNLDNPEPSANRSESYRHGFLNGRDDRAGSPRALASELRLAADAAIARDVARAKGDVPNIRRPPSADGFDPTRTST
jgi:hypothetical protein